MNLLRTSLVVLLFLAALPLAAEKPPVATVNMQKLFAEYHVAVEKRGSIDSIQERLKDNPRMKTLTKVSSELQALKEKILDPEVDDSDKERWFDEFKSKSKEFKALQRDTQQHVDSEQAKINAKLVKMTRSILADIRTAVAHVAEREGYELVLESEGRTSSQLPTLLYIRRGDDITKLVLSHLNKGHEAKAPADSGGP